MGGGQRGIGAAALAGKNCEGGREGGSRENGYASHYTEAADGGGVLVHHALDVEQLGFLEIGGLAQVADDGQVLHVQRAACVSHISHVTCGMSRVTSLCQRPGVLEQAHEQVEAQEADAVENAHAVPNHLPVIAAMRGG